MLPSNSQATVRRLRDRKLCALALAIMVIFGGAHLVAPDVPWLRRLELLALDLQLRLRGAQRPGSETVIVMIDDATIAELGQWPVPRRKLAELVTTLHRAGASVVGVDILFGGPEVARSEGGNRDDTDGDTALSRAIEVAGNVVLPFSFTFGGERDPAPGLDLARFAYTTLRKAHDYRPGPLVPTGLVTPPTALAAKSTLGHVLVAYDVDGAPRYEYPALEYDLDYYPSMSVRIAQRFLGVPWSDVVVELGRGISLGTVFVPTDSEMRLLVNYLGGSGAFPTHSLSRVLSGAVPDSAFRNRIVLVGSSALGTGDTFESPFTAVMPGVERLATIVDSIVHQRYLRRAPAAPWLEITLMLGAALALGLAVSRLSLAAASLCAIGMIALVAASGYVALVKYGLWQASAVPVIAIILTFTGLSLYRYALLDRERRHTRRVFQRYLAPDMVDRVIASPTLPELGGEMRDLTIMFCDLRGFTTLAERLDPPALSRIVNTFLSAATDAVLEYGGTVDKYVGDAIMAFWNAPLDQPEHAALACRTALRILEKIEGINASAQDANLPRLSVGIGINTGRCTVGHFGSRHRLDYSVIGDAANIAARLEGETKTYGIAILLGPETTARVGNFATLPVARVRLRGRTEILQIHALVGDEGVRQSATFRDLRSKPVISADDIGPRFRLPGSRA